ncbi:MAG: helix-turn-helix transcriptional regulator [Candidatus Eremiobacteraeota bacterium]|nr:helix-turn-helix transcriptional regulator [Candidatus Eremiobacteraeota bacterium]
MINVTLDHLGFDAEEFEKAFTAADFDRCHELVEAGEGFDAVLAGARVRLRERRYLETIGALSDVAVPSGKDRIARDVLLGAALGFTRDYVGGRRLIARALNDLSPGSEWYYDAVHYLGLIGWMRQDQTEAQEAASTELGSADPNHRARARILLSWVALRRGQVLLQVDELQKALDELETAAAPDQQYRANALLTLTLLCRELPLPQIAERARAIFEALPWTSGLRRERFLVTRFLAAIDELNGNELAAFAGFRKAARLAPSEHWGVLCFLDRALLAKNTGEIAFATEQLQEAHEIAQRLSWNEVSGEERSALLVLAELFAYSEPATAEQYLARFRTLSTSVIPILSYGTDPRVKGFEAYSQGVAWLHLGDIGASTAALTEAWSIFEDFNYAWRCALCALALYEATSDQRWIQRAARKIDSWPQSWIARHVACASNSSVLRLDKIPPAKRDVLELVRAGRRNSEIAEQLGRSPNTVRNQLSQLFATFNVRSRAELVALLSKPVVSINEYAHRRRHS